jgi:hypothetical protein
MLQRVHRILVENELGAKLPYDGLAFFLECCRERIGSIERNDEVAALEVNMALIVVKLYNKRRGVRTTSEEHAVSIDDFALALSSVKDVIDQIDKHIHDSAAALMVQHGGILKHSSIKDLMSKFGNAVDVATAQSL